MHLVGVDRDQILVLLVARVRLLADLAAAQRPGPVLLGQRAVKAGAGLLEASHLQRGYLQQDKVEH